MTISSSWRPTRWNDVPQTPLPCQPATDLRETVALNRVPSAQLSVGTTCSVQLVSAPSPRDLGVRRSADPRGYSRRSASPRGDYTPSTHGKGMPSIFSAPLPAIQERIVAFAPFVDGMDLSHWTFVVALPVERTPLQDDSEHGGSASSASAEVAQANPPQASLVVHQYCRANRQDGGGDQAFVASTFPIDGCYPICGAPPVEVWWSSSS
jgi:hypothetical protein